VLTEISVIKQLRITRDDVTQIGLIDFTIQERNFNSHF